MDVVLLSRLQFAVATCFHFLFVPLTLGLSFFIAILETAYVRTGNEEYKTMTKFWGRLFIINFAIGIATGLTLEFQFGTNWASFSAYVGDLFGSLLAIEATVAFFLESTFLGIWIFGWNKVSKKFHVACIWIVAIASNTSAFWIIVANSWMQHPVGYIIRNGRAELYNFWAVISQPFALLAFSHTILAALTLTCFFVLGISSYHILRNHYRDQFLRIFRVMAAVLLIVSVSEVVIGDFHGKEVGKVQPSKVAAMEAIWETTEGAPFHLLIFPDESHEKNYFEFGTIPKLLSWLVHGDKDALFKGLNGFSQDLRPPVTIVFLAFRLMVGLGFFFILVAAITFYKRRTVYATKWLLYLLICCIPLPYLTSLLGWIVTEVGRQPWIVFGMMKTSNAASVIPPLQVVVSLTAFIVLYSLLGLANFYLIIKNAKKGLNKSPQPI